MDPLAAVMMVLICGVVWGGLFACVALAVSREASVG